MHQEFGGRITVKDGAAALDHATHVGGTIAALGLNASARGMATAVRLDSYEWTGDKSELTARGAAYPGEPGKIYLSNQSYGYVSGWNYTTLASPVWDWWGVGTTAASNDPDFGKYDANARDSDAVAFSAPWLLMFRSAGNDRSDNPTAGQAVSFTPGGTVTVNYDPAVHPAGDAVYKNGYDTLGYDSTGKNVLTVGSVPDAVSAGVRNPGVANLSVFSSCGPTDDGRIKPDVVANGENLFSTFAAGDSSYSSISGTSMATPNATGSAALLVSYWERLFPGQALRASTLKGLIIHTATDRGNPGPDYQYGWGLVNVKAAADVLKSYQAAPGNAAVNEARLTTAAPVRVHAFVWDGVSPIRATLVWTDPAGAATTTGDSHTARLVNNLDLTITAPGLVDYQPWLMPWVGDWTNAKLSAPAVTGKNNTDNVEQVYLAAPPAAGTYQAVVSVDGALAGGVQAYSLIISGGAEVSAAPPVLTSVAPTAGAAGPVVLNLGGNGFIPGATVKLTKPRQTDIPLNGIEVLGDTVKARADLTGLPPGIWNAVITNPDQVSVTLTDAFTVIGTLWQDTLENGTAGWTHGNSQGSTDNWALGTTRYHSSSHGFAAAAPATTNINDLVSPVIAVPAKTSSLNFSFWHNYSFQSGRDGGVLEFSLDGGTWVDVTAAGSGAAFASGGYTGNFINSGSKNPLAPRSAWTGSNTGFTQVVVNLTDTARYAGHNLQARWRLASNSSTSSTGWALDDIALNGGAAVNLPPVISPVLAAAAAMVTGDSTVLSVSASDDGGAEGLYYTWFSTGGSFSHPVTFGENGTNLASSTTVTFTAAGDYAFRVEVRDAEGLTATADFRVMVQATPVVLMVNPAEVTLGKGDHQTFSVAVKDQFGADIVPPPLPFWETGGGGVMGQDGVFQAATVGGPYTVSATTISSSLGAVTGSARVDVTGVRLALWKSLQFTPEEVAAGLADNGADADADGFSNFVEYALGTDPRAPTPWPGNQLDAQGRLSLELTLPLALPDVSYFGEASGDISAWDTPVPLEVMHSGDPQWIRLTDPRGTGDSRSRFLRLRVAPFGE